MSGRIKLRVLLSITGIFLFFFSGKGEDGYKLWLRYSKIQNTEILNSYVSQISSVVISEISPELEVLKQELNIGLSSMLNIIPDYKSGFDNQKSLIISTIKNCDVLSRTRIRQKTDRIGPEGFVIFSEEVNASNCIFILAEKPIGLLYGTFHFLRLLQMQEGISKLYIHESPKVKFRLLNHWDNLDRTVERGYAGFSIWDWHKLPEYIDQRYIDYARANASIGINGAVLTNVNANSWALTPSYLEKVSALADVFRPYGIKVFLTARFSSPAELGKLDSSDPLDPLVKEWWQNKLSEIYHLIPDFGGFLVKANSEGQPGPQDYGRNHADGANMLADVLQEYGGIVIWRAFVYSKDVADDRAMQAYSEFKPLDGKFRKNVIVQVKNGAIDFQPREPFHPLFGSAPNTNLGMEFQITQEYLGQGTHLVYLAPLFKECLDSETYAKGAGSEVAKVIDGSLSGNNLTCMAGVANIGTDRNWTGHHFGQANWYAFGRLAWDHELSSEQIADEWIKQTFGDDELFRRTISKLMLDSREICVNYMTPLGLHHIMGRNHHYGPGPWVEGGRPDWTSVYYHQADSSGVGFNRSVTGSNAVSQYHEKIGELFNNPETCPEKYLLWFHHLNWNYKLDSGRTLWEELCFSYDNGAKNAQTLIEIWQQFDKHVDNQRYIEILSMMKIQAKEAARWRDACLLYFQSKSGLAFPENIQKPILNLDYYKNMRFPYAPGIKPEW